MPPTPVFAMASDQFEFPLEFRIDKLAPSKERGYTASPIDEVPSSIG